MKRLLLAALSSTVILFNSAHAFLPEDGAYVGLFGGGAKPLKTSASSTPFATLDSAGVITSPFKYSFGLDGGMNVGYRKQKFRVEGSLIYVRTSINEVTVNGMPETAFTELGVSGKNTTIGGFVNLLYDFTDFNLGQRETNAMPFLGIGAGAMRIEHQTTSAGSISGTTINPNITKKRGTEGAAQFLAGFNFFLDSYSFFYINYQYAQTLSAVSFLGARYQQHAFNAGLNLHV